MQTAKDISKVGSFPSDLAPAEEKKTREYGLQYAKAIYSNWAGAEDFRRKRRIQDFEEARRYRNGTQSVTKYLDMADINGDNSWVNLNIKPLPIVSKFVDLIVGGFMNIDYKIVSKAVDKQSVSHKESVKTEIVKRVINKDFYKEIYEAMGMQNPMETDFNSIDEVELFMDMSFKEAVEIAAELCIEGVFNLNDKEEVKRQLLEDLVTCGIAGTHVSLDPNYGAKIRAVDPENLIYSNSQRGDFKDIKYAGELVATTIAELRRISGLPEEILEKIAHSVAGKNGNPERFRREAMLATNTANNFYEYDDFTVTYMSFAFKTTNSLTYEKKPNKFGGFFMNKKASNYQIPEKYNHERQLLRENYEVVYTGCWVVQTDYIFDYGLMNNQLRKNGSLKKTELPYKIYALNFYKMGMRSLVQRMIPHADEMQIAHLKLQQFMLKSRPPGLAIEVGALSSISLDGGDGEMTPADQIRLFDQTGNMVWKLLDDSGFANGRPPFEELKNGVNIESFRALIEVYNTNLQQMRDVTGVNEYRDGSGADSNTLVGVQKMAIAASNNATKNIYEAYVHIIKRTAEDVILAIQDLVRYGDGIDRYEGVFGSFNVETLKAIKDIPIHDFSVFFEYTQDEEQRMILEQNIQASLAAQELRIEDAIMIRDIKNMKYANKFLSLRRKRYQQEKQAMEERNIELNAQAQAEAAERAAQAEMQKDEAKAMLKEREIQAQLQADLQRMQAKFEMEMALAQQNGEFKVAAAQAQIEGQTERDQMKERKKDERQREQKSMESSMIEQRKDRKGEQNFEGAPDIASMLMGMQGQE
jgi:hypothetical protein